MHADPSQADLHAFKAQERETTNMTVQIEACRAALEAPTYQTSYTYADH